MERASRNNDHDLYNRAYNLSRQVENYPSFPLTGVQKTLLAILAGLQFGLTKLSPPIVAFLSRWHP
jgi:hypothetical protein